MFGYWNKTTRNKWKMRKKKTYVEGISHFWIRASRGELEGGGKVENWRGTRLNNGWGRKVSINLVFPRNRTNREHCSHVSGYQSVLGVFATCPSFCLRDTASVLCHFLGMRDCSRYGHVYISYFSFIDFYFRTFPCGSGWLKV